jgi:magnesium-transporting ATPase (P-type)
MVVHRFWADGEELEPGGRSTVPQPFSGPLRTAVRCSNAALSPSEDGWERTGDPSEIALLAAAAELGEDILGAQRERGQRRRKLYHFDSRLKRMTTADEETDGGLWYHAKGAPLELLERCSRVRGLEGDRDLTIRDRETVRHAFEDYAGRGLRVLGFAERRSGTGEPDEERIGAESGLTFLGLATLEDPPRPDVEEAVGRCREAGIRIIVITGDHGLTAGAVARRVGIVRGEPRMVSGPEIGIAMGSSGTEVAREAATMVLTDDSFSSIIAIEEGRVVYDNIRKFVTYIFAHATPEVVPFLIYALSGGAVPLPLTVMQILATDLGTETLPALALGREPAEPGIMRRPPRPREKGIMDRQMLTRAWGWLELVEAALGPGKWNLVRARRGTYPLGPLSKRMNLSEMGAISFQPSALFVAES